MLKNLFRKLWLTMCFGITILCIQQYSANLRELIQNQRLIFMEVNFYGNENEVMWIMELVLSNEIPTGNVIISNTTHQLNDRLFVTMVTDVTELRVVVTKGMAVVINVRLVIKLYLIFQPYASNMTNHFYFIGIRKKSYDYKLK